MPASSGIRLGIRSVPSTKTFTRDCRDLKPEDTKHDEFEEVIKLTLIQKMLWCSGNKIFLHYLSEQLTSFSLHNCLINNLIRIDCISSMLWKDTCMPVKVRELYLNTDLRILLK